MEIQLTVHLPVYLVEYLKGFLQKKGHGYYLTRANAVGKFINSVIEQPYGPTEPDGNIRIYLPYHPGVLNPYSRNYISKENQKRLADYLAAVFDNELNAVILMYTQIGLNRNTAIEHFMQRRNISWDARNFEAIKKKEYRFRSKLLNDYRKQLQSSESYAFVEKNS